MTSRPRTRTRTRKIGLLPDRVILKALVALRLLHSLHKLDDTESPFRLVPDDLERLDDEIDKMVDSFRLAAKKAQQ